MTVRMLQAIRVQYHMIYYLGSREPKFGVLTKVMLLAPDMYDTLPLTTSKNGCTLSSL